MKAAADEAAESRIVGLLPSSGVTAWDSTRRCAVCCADRACGAGAQSQSGHFCLI